ncbi:MAG: DUF1080 domain-containing protein [Planctomycetes bacterium]|nr:DUF1080 domain-containing protein [Planctomycetota bacterium]
MIMLWMVAALAVQDPVALFNGKDLSGWTTWLGDTKREDPRGVYCVRDGAIRISGDGFGYLATEKSYQDYRLVAEFKWGKKNWRGREQNARDSGLFLHATGPDGNSYDGAGAFRCAVECQVMQGRVGDLMLIRGKDEAGKPIPMRFTAQIAPGRDPEGWPTWKKDGDALTMERGRLNWWGIDPAWKDTLDFRGAKDVESPVGEWTRIECVCDGGRIAVTVNGTRVNEVTEATPRSGRILLQCEGSEIFFRKVELHPLREGVQK